MDSTDSNVQENFTPETASYNAGIFMDTEAPLSHLDEPYNMIPAFTGHSDDIGNSDMFAQVSTNPPQTSQNYENESEDTYIPSGEEVTGRWTKEEHELFLAALKKYGKVYISCCFI